MTTKLLLAAGALASAHAHVMQMPHSPLAVSPRPVLSARAGSAVNMAVFNNGDIKDSLEKIATQEKATYAIFWTRDGPNFVAAADYTSPSWAKVLQNSRADANTFSSKSAGMRIPAEGDEPIATVARTGQVMTDAGAHPSFSRVGLVREFDVSKIHVVPYEDGVLEFGSGKLAQFGFEATASTTVTDRDIGRYTGLRFPPNAEETPMFERLVLDNPVEKERTRVARRDVYSYDSWLWHRSPGRLIRNFQGTFNSNVLRNVRYEVMTVAALASLVCLYNDDVAVIAELFRNFDMESIADLIDSRPLLQISMLPFTLASPALFLLLVFRTNASYDRWWEARKVWGATINTCRDAARQITMRSPDREVSRKAVAQIAAFPYVMLTHLRGAGGANPISAEQKLVNDEYLEKTLDRLLGEDDRKYIMSKAHRPMTLLMELSQSVRDTELTTFDRLTIDRAMTLMLDYVGMCERIFKSPIPVFYTRHTARFLITWLLFLPLGLYPNLNPHWLVVPVTIMLSYFLLGIEELGVQIEEPFSVLPLESMAAGIEGSIFEALNCAEDRYDTPNPKTMDVTGAEQVKEEALAEEVVYQNMPSTLGIVSATKTTVDGNNIVTQETPKWYKGMRV